jgi:hypothetical protein
MLESKTCLSDRGSSHSGGLEKSCGSGSSVGEKVISSIGSRVSPKIGDKATSSLLWNVMRIPPLLRGSVDFFIFE